MPINLPAKGHVHFDSTMGTSFTFPRPINRLLLTAESGTVSMSLDNGDGYMLITTGTHQFDIYRYRIDFAGGGVFSGIGISL